MGRFTRRFSVRVGGALSLVGFAKIAYAKYDTSPMRVQFVGPEATSSTTRRSTMSRLKGNGAPSESGEVWDVVVVGGGAVGLYTALDAALRGLTVVLLEAEDFSSGATGSGGRLIPGGFYAAQQALRQKDVIKLKDCLQVWRDMRTWSNVAPTLCQTNMKTLLPVLHTTELLEVRLAVYISTFLSMFVGPFRWGRMMSIGKDDGLCSFLKPEERPPCGAALVHDAYINPSEACVALARTAQAAGAVIVNHAPCVRLLPLDQSGCEAKVVVHGRDGLTGELFDLRARCVVNCAGAWADTIRSNDTVAQPPTAYSRFQSSLRLVVPRSSLPIPPEINGVVVSSSLKTFSSVNILPWDDGYVTVGFSTIPVAEISSKVGPEPFALHVSSDFFASQAGRIIASMRTVGMNLEAGDIVSAVNSVLPVMMPPSDFPGTSGVVFDGYCLESHLPVPKAVPPLAGNGGMLPMLNVFGGSVGCSRRIAERAVDAVLAMLDRPHVRCRTARVGLVGCSADERSRSSTSDDQEAGHEALVKRMVDEQFALTVTDVLSRRVAGSFGDPAGAAEGVRPLAECLGRFLGWTPDVVHAEVTKGRAFLASILVDSKRAAVAADQSL